MKEKFKKNLGQTQGTILIISLWMTVILSLLAIGLAHRALIETRLIRLSRDKTKAAYLARAAVSKAVAELGRDENPFDSLNERWSSGIDFETKSYLFKDIKLKDGQFSVSYMLLENESKDTKIYGLCDEERKININKCIDPKPLFKQQLQGLFSSIELDRPEELVDIVVDWIDQNQISSGGGPEDSAFKNSQLRCPEELLDILRYYFHNRLNIPKDEAYYKAVDIFSKIKNKITLWGQGQININTASAQVLSILFGVCIANQVQGATDSEADNLVDKIILFRQGDNGEGFDEDDNSFEKSDTGYIISRLEAYIEKLSSAQRNMISYILANQLITVKSNHFCIESTGTVNNISQKILAVVERNNLKTPVYWYED